MPKEAGVHAQPKPAVLNTDDPPPPSKSASSKAQDSEAGTEARVQASSSEGVPADLYSILQVDPGATAEQIRAEYRRLVRAVHPDHNGDPAAAAEFARINKAYLVLRDPSLRARYDAVRADARRAA